MNTPNTKQIKDALDAYGSAIVNTVLTLVNVSDPDGAYTHFEDEGMHDHADCVAFIYFPHEYMF